jgi:selT/selW/selH-like putative selenoprotein
MGLMILIVGGDNVKPYLTFIPDRVFQFINEKKWMLGIASFFLGSQLSSSLGSTGAFEVTCNGSLIWSKLQKHAIPTVEQISNLVKNFGYELV